MVSAETIEHTIFTLGVAIGLIFLIFVVKIPVACTGCDSPVGVWYRCFSGGDSSNTCDSGSGGSGNFTNQVKEIVKELIDAGINLPKTIIDGVIYIKNKLVTLAVGIFDTIKAVLSDAYSTMSQVYNDYIKGPVVSGYTFIKDNVVLPIIQGVTDYIVRPIQDLIEKIIGLKDTVFRAIKTAFKITHDIAVEVFDVTYGALIYGFDQIPYGLVSFVETIQDVLNTLKNGIIGRVPANNIPDGGMNKALYKTLNGIQTAVNTVTGGANYVIDPVVNGIVDAVNAFSLRGDVLSRVENVIPKTTFADNYRSWIPNPADLFWAGTKSVPMSDIVSSVDLVCPLVCKNYGFDTGKKNTNTGKTNGCICIKDVTLSNNNALLSCTDICSTVGGISMLPAQGKVCPVCSNEIIFPYNPFELHYSFVIAFENTPFLTLKSSIKYSTTATYTPDQLSTTLKTLLIEDVTKTLTLKNIDILSQGQVPVSLLNFSTATVTPTPSPTPTPTPTPTRVMPTPTPTPMPTTATKFSASWLDITYVNGLYRLDFTPEATTQLAAVASALSLTTVGIDIILSFSTNTLLAQSYGFTSDTKLSTNDTVTTTMTSTYTVPLSSSTVLSYLRTSGKALTDLVREKDSTGNFTGNVIIPYPSTPIVSTVTPINAFISYRGYNFYYLNGFYYVVMNNTFYKLNDQTIPKSTDNNFKFIQLQSAMNCASPFSLKPYPNPNALKFTYMDKTLNFSEIIYFPTCPIYKAKRTILMGADLDDAVKNGRPTFRTTFYHLAVCSDSSTTQNMADYYTQQTFLTTMAFLLWDKIDTYAGKIIHRTPPFIFTVANGNLSMELTTTGYDISGNIVSAPRDASGYISSGTFYDNGGNVLTPTNNPAVKLTASLTLHLSQYPIIAYNFNRKTDITMTSMETFIPSSYQLNAFDTPSNSLSIKYGLGTTTDKSGNYFQITSANNFIVYEFKDILNEYAYTSTTILPIGTYTYDQIGSAFANALASDINSNTDNFYNFNAITTTTTDSNGNQTLSYSNEIGSTYSTANTNTTITTNFLKFNMSVITQDRPDANDNTFKCFPYIPSNIAVNVSIPSSYIDPTTTLFNTYKVIETNNTEQYEYYNLYGEYVELTFDEFFSLGEYEIIPRTDSAYLRKDDSATVIINKNNIDIYEVWIVGSNDGIHWYKVDNQTSIESISYTPMINEQALIYKFKTYRIIVTRMFNTPTTYPSSYIINQINLYDTTFVRQAPKSYKTSNTTSTTWPVLPTLPQISLPTTLYQPKLINNIKSTTFYQGSTYTPITVGIKQVVNNVVGASKPAPPSINPNIIAPTIPVDTRNPITIKNTISKHGQYVYEYINSMYEQLCMSDDGKLLFLFDVRGSGYINRDNNNVGQNTKDLSNNIITSSTITTLFYSSTQEVKYDKFFYYNKDDYGLDLFIAYPAPAVSGDGNIIYIGMQSGVSISKDRGFTFTPTILPSVLTTTGDDVEQIFKMATSYDGSYVVACVCKLVNVWPNKESRGSVEALKDLWDNIKYATKPAYNKLKYFGTKVISSNDGGATWRRVIPFKYPTSCPVDIAISSDGKYQIVLTNLLDVTTDYGTIYISSNYGFSFKKLGFDFNFHFLLNKSILDTSWYNTSSITMSKNGQYIIIPVMTPVVNGEISWILKSNDYGASWSRDWPNLNLTQLNYYKEIVFNFCGDNIKDLTKTESCTINSSVAFNTAGNYTQTNAMSTISCISKNGQYQFINIAYKSVDDTIYKMKINNTQYRFYISTTEINDSNPGEILYKTLSKQNQIYSNSTIASIHEDVSNTIKYWSTGFYRKVYKERISNNGGLNDYAHKIEYIPELNLSYDGKKKIYYSGGGHYYSNPCAPGFFEYEEQQTSNIAVPGPRRFYKACQNVLSGIEEGPIPSNPNGYAGTPTSSGNWAVPLVYCYIKMVPDINGANVIFQSSDYGLNFYPFFSIKTSIKSFVISEDLTIIVFTDGAGNTYTLQTSINDTQICPNTYTNPNNLSNDGNIINQTLILNYNKGSSGDITQFKSALLQPNQLNVLTVNPNSTLSKYFSDFNGLNWYNVNTLTAEAGTKLPPYSYNSFNVSDDGEFYTIISNINGIYNSYDGGKKWALEPTTVSISWKIVKLNSTGQYGLACSITNTLYRTTDYGKTWGTIKIQSPTTNSIIIFNDIALSLTGQYQTIVTNNTGVYYSNNFGRTWQNTSWTHSKWTLVSVSASGKEQVITGPGSPYVAYSSDYGNTFNTPILYSTSKPTGNKFSNYFNPVILTQSASGQYITIATSDYGLYSSFDYAQTWYGKPTTTSFECGKTPPDTFNQKWTLGCMSNYATLLKTNQIQTLEQDGKYQVFSVGTTSTTGGVFWYTTTYGMVWDRFSDNNNNGPLGFFRYVPDALGETGLLNFRYILTNGNIFDGRTFQFRFTVTGNPFPDCFYSNITYAPSFTCNTQASNWNVRTAKIIIKFSDSKMSSTLKYALGIQSTADLEAKKTATDLILFDNPGVYTSPLPNTLFMFDPITPPFCGQDKEFKIPQAPNGLAYYFLGSGYAVSNILTLPLNPIMDNYGTTQLGMSYSTSLIISTISYLLAQDIRAQTDGAAKPTFNFFFNNSTKQLRLAFNSSYTTPATLVLRTSLNLIMSNAWGANGSDLILSSNSVITYSPSVVIPATDLINDMINTSLNYRVIDTTGYAYAGRLSSTPANGNTVEYFVETILTRLLVNDINLKGTKKFNLSSNAFKFEVFKEFNANQDRVIKTYDFDFNDPQPTLAIILQFSKNEEWGKVLGISEDITLFNVNSSQVEVTDNISDNEIFDTYKGWYYYFFNNNYYFYIRPYLLKMSQLPSPSSEILITADELKTYYSFNTSTDKEDVYYYNGNNDYYVLVDENFVYLIDFQAAINLGNGTPYSEGYIEKVSPDGFTYYNSPNEDWYVKGQTIDMFENTVDTMIQVNRSSLLLVTVNPNSVSYTYNSSTRSFDGTVTLPNGPFTPDTFASTLSGLLTKDIQTREPILDSAIQIQYEALTIDQQPTSQRYTFKIQNDKPFQLVLKCGTNPILASNLGVSSDIKINPIYPLVSTNLTAVVTDPRSIAYKFVDSNFNYTRYITLPSSTPTPDELCTQLSSAIMTDIITYTGYGYTNDMMIMTYDTNTSKYTFTLYTPIPTLITLKFNESIGTLYQRTIPPSTWAKTLGCNAMFTFSNTPTVSPNEAVPINPMILTYTFTDTASSTAYSSSITFKDTTFNDSATGDSILNELSSLLFTDINSKQQRYGLLPTDLIMNYDPSGKIYSFAVKSYAFSINIKFGESSLLGLNFGALSDIEFSTLNPVISSVAANMTYDTFHTITMFMYQGQPSVFINTGTTNTSGLYGLVVGSDLCLNNMKCVERLLIDPTLTLAAYGYIVQPTGYYTKINAYVYDAKVQRLYLMLSTEVQKFYGSAEKNGFSVLTTCTLDSAGNCIPSSLNIIKLGNSTYVLLDKDVKTLLPFARDSVTEPSCPCHITANIIPTCNEVCSTKTSKNLNLPGGSNDPLLCANANDDPLQTPCKCYYNGPVNVIIKPMQQYNPFRLLQSAFSSGGDSFLSGVANAVKGFMLPLWNTVKQVTAFLSSITAMIVEAITTYANPNYVFNLLKNLAVLGAQEAMDQLKSFWNETIKPGLEGLWAYRIVLIQKMKEGLSWVWENLKSALKALSVTISDIAVTVFGVVKSGISFVWEKFSYYTGAILDAITPFIPIGPTIKFNVFLWVMLIVIGAFIGVDELLITAYDTASVTISNAKDSIGKVGGIFKSIVTGT